MLNYIKSKDVRAHITCTGLQFSDSEIGTLIFHSGMPYHELHRALKELAEKTTDQELRRQIGERIAYDERCRELFRTNDGSFFFEVCVDGGSKEWAYLRRAADNNHPWANYLLGKLYLTGNGVPKDEEAAWNCFRMADAFGHPYAQYVLERQEQWQRPELLLTVSRLLYHMSNIFRDNAPTAPAQPRLHIDRKRMRELQELRIALGHQPDDHEEEQTQTQTWGGMTMKGW